MRPALAYLLAGAIGAAAMFAMIPWATITGSGGLWIDAPGDAAMGLAGHLAYQAPGWHWPLLRAGNLFWPDGASIILTDSNPAVSLTAKLLAGMRGRPANLLGFWLGLCWVLQPVGAVYALRGWRARPSWAAILAVALLSLMCPAWLFRHHINLLGHFILLGALGLSLRLCAGKAAWWMAGLWLMLAMLVHPYMFAFSAAMLLAPVLEARRVRVILAYAVCCIAPPIVLRVLGGAVNAGASGFTTYSMNLISPVWPQRSGLFGAALPIVDATGGQYEGFNYLGAGALVLIGCAWWAGPGPEDWRQRAGQRGLMLPLIALTLLALTPRIYAGHWLVLPLPSQPWQAMLGTVQSSGRAFWVVGYVLVIGAVARLDRRFNGGLLWSLLALAVGLQFIDTQPLRAADAKFLGGHRNVAPPFAVPPTVTLLRIVPACDAATWPADQFRLNAAQQSIRLADIRLARTPPGFDCEKWLSDGLESPLGDGEMRIFLPASLRDLRQEALGDGVGCVLAGAGAVCTRKVANPPAGLPAPPGRPIPMPGPSAGVAAYLGGGWRVDRSGVAWTDGPRASLLFRLPVSMAGAGAQVILDWDGIAASAGGVREVVVRVYGGAATTLALNDLLPTQTALLAKGGVVRIVLDTRRPIDPRPRGLSSPANRVAVRLRAVRLSAAP